jgi:hypothetical protein
MEEELTTPMEIKISSATPGASILPVTDTIIPTLKKFA